MMLHIQMMSHIQSETPNSSGNESDIHDSSKWRRKTLHCSIMTWSWHCQATVISAHATCARWWSTSDSWTGTISVPRAVHHQQHPEKLKTVQIRHFQPHHHQQHHLKHLSDAILSALTLTTNNNIILTVYWTHFWVSQHWPPPPTSSKASVGRNIECSSTHHQQQHHPKRPLDAMLSAPALTTTTNIIQSVH